VKELYVEALSQFENQTVTGFFVAGKREQRSKSDGSVYLALTLCDRTGQLDARMWEASDAGPFLAGDVVKVRGLVCRYNDKLQIKVEQLRRTEDRDEGSFAAADFVPSSSYDIDELWARLRAHMAAVEQPHLRAVLELFADDPELSRRLREAPAAKSLHHAWLGGLLEHLCLLVDLCVRVAPQYPEVNRDLLVTGAILHDIGKLYELKWGTTLSYTDEGQLLGHISIGLRLFLEKAAQVPDFPPRLRTLVEHLILSHHGRLEYGSPKLPMIPEALVLHALDDLEAKMENVRGELKRAVASGRPAGTVTEWVRSLERPVLDTQAFLAGE
jgi:3'-5' exoribonuclease